MGDVFDQIQAEATAAQSPAQKFWNTLKEGNLAKIGSFVFNDLPSAVSSPAAAYRAADFATNLGRGMIEEPGRIAQEVREAGKAYRAGDYDKLETHLRQAIPLVGPQGEKALRQLERGETAEGLANMLDLVGQFAGPEIVSEFGPRVLSGTTGRVLRAAEGPTGRGVAAGVRAGGPQVAKGALKTGAGLALGTHGPLPTLADALLGIKFGESGLKDIASGTSAGWDAFKQAKADALAAEARAAQPPVQRTAPAWTQAAESAPVAAQPVEPIPSQLPSGRVPGGIQNQAPITRAAGSPGEPAPVPAAAAPAEAGPSAELLDQIALDLSGKPFAKLNANGQATVRSVAERLGQDVPEAVPAPAPAAAPVPEDVGVAPGTTVADLIKQEAAARRAAAPAPEAPTPAEAPAAAPAPPEPAPAPAAPEIGPGTTPAGLEEQLKASIEQTNAKKAAASAQAEDIRAAHRAKPGGPADNISKLLVENGQTLAQIDALEPAAQAEFWKNAGGLHRKGYKPSPDTIALIRERMAHLEAGKAAAAQPAPVVPNRFEALAGQFADAGIGSEIVAKYPPAIFEKLGIAPNEVKPLLETMRAEEAWRHGPLGAAGQ